MRCSDCNKFVSNGDPEAEVQSGEDFEMEIDEIMIPCGECGTELKDTTFNFEMEGEHECSELPNKLGNETAEGTVEVEATDDFRTKDRHGKPIKNARYQAHLYGADVTATVTCPFCQEEIIFSEHDEIESSSMDELT